MSESQEAMWPAVRVTHPRMRAAFGSLLSGHAGRHTLGSMNREERVEEEASAIVF